jgi:hypothetical protein
MVLSTLRKFEASSRRSLNKYDFIKFDVCTDRGEKLGKVADILVNENGHCQYVVIALNAEMGGKQVLLSYEKSQVDQATCCINISGLDQAQLSNLETYNSVDPQTTPSVIDDKVNSLDYPL